MFRIIDFLLTAAIDIWQSFQFVCLVAMLTSHNVQDGANRDILPEKKR